MAKLSFKRLCCIALCTLLISVSAPVVQTAIFPTSDYAVAGRSSRSSGSSKTASKSQTKSDSGMKSSKSIGGDDGGSVSSPSRPRYSPSVSSATGAKAIARAKSLNDSPRPSTDSERSAFKAQVEKGTKKVASSEVVAPEHSKILTDYNNSFRTIKAMKPSERVESNPVYVTNINSFYTRRSFLSTNYPSGYYPNDFDGEVYPIDGDGNMMIVDEENEFLNFIGWAIQGIFNIVVFLVVSCLLFWLVFKSLKGGQKVWDKLQADRQEKINKTRRR
jgi:hypothetical protein